MAVAPAGVVGAMARRKELRVSNEPVLPPDPLPEKKLPLILQFVKGIVILIAGTLLFGFLVFGLYLLAVATSGRR